MPNSFGETLKELRVKAGLSQAELSEATGFNQAAISYWERGDREPTWVAVQTLAQSLGVSCEHFKTLEPIEVKPTASASEPEKPKKPRGRPKKET